MRTQQDPLLQYWLPRTEFVLTAARRQTVVTRDEESTLRLVTDVALAAGVVQDPEARQVLALDVGVLEKISLKISLDDRGFVTAVNAETSRDVSPVLNVVSKVVSAAVTGLVPMLPEGVDAEPVLEDSLETAWASRFKMLAAARTALNDQAGRLLTELTDTTATADAVSSAGKALVAVQDQLALISEARRTWIAGQATNGERRTWRLRTADLVLLQGPDLPRILTSPPTDGLSAEIASSHGVLVGIVDPYRQVTTSAESGTDVVTDGLVLRRARPCVLGVYIRTEDQWLLDDTTVRFLDVVDEMSVDERLDLDGHWWRTRGLELEYYPDMSIKSFGVSSSPAAATVLASVGDLVSASGTAAGTWADRPTGAERQLEAATTQLDLLKAAGDYEVLSATRGRQAELAVLEQQKKIREVSA